MTHCRPHSRRRLWMGALGALVGWALALALPALAKAAPADVLRPQATAWSVLGAGARAGPTQEAGWSRSQSPALDYRYQVGKGQVSVLTLPIDRAALSRAAGLSFAAKASNMTNLTVSLEDQSGQRWTLPALLNADQWQKVHLGFDDFILATDSDAGAGTTRRVDPARIQRVTVVDTEAMLVSASGDVLRLFGIEAGSRRLVLDDVAFTGVSTRDVVQVIAHPLDGFDRQTLPWSVFGALRAESSTAAPLLQAGWVVDYRKRTGLVTSLLLQMPPGALVNAAGLELSIASRVKTSLVIKLEQTDGATFETDFTLPGDSTLHALQLKLSDFKRSDDSKTRNSKVDSAKLSTLLILDIGGLFTSKADNRLWLQQVAATGGKTTRVSGDKAVPTAEKTATVVVAGWSSWSKRLMHVHAGHFPLVGDPSVMRDGSVYRMFHTCYDPVRAGPAVCQAISSDGFDWHDVEGDDKVPGRMLHTRVGQWDDTHETPFAIKFDGKYLLYFSGYKDRGGHFNSLPLAIGLVESPDGVKFERKVTEPVLQGTPGGYDSDAVFSPSIIEHAGQLVMIYTGYCFDTCKREKGVYLLAATSTNGRDWVKRDRPVMSKADFPGTKYGAAEAELVKGPDNHFYLFMTHLIGDDHHGIGIARSSTPFGPWDIAPESIIRRSSHGFDNIGPVAPSVLFEGGKVRMWFSGFGKDKTIKIGYAEADWPLRFK